MQTTLIIEGMHCGGCVKSVANALSALPLVSSVDIDLDTGQARINHDGAAPDALVGAVEDAGFDAALATGA
ncbi:heavy-metal-associated domain-containing protein [Zhengella sp. ZM62]|uniref:heavy-metal-associated domain-containing protein n=1 Tax=Zhengella sedimenti TaxID=3390035 RepID=UPI003974EE33